MSRESADAIAALRVNAAFYSAMAAGDLAAMDAVWARDEPVLCIHPGGPPLQGRVEVMASFRSLFDAVAPPIEFSRDAVSLVRGLAFVGSECCINKPKVCTVPERPRVLVRSVVTVVKRAARRDLASL